MARAAETFIWSGASSSNPVTPGNWKNAAGTPYTVDYPGWDGTASVNVNGDMALFNASITNAPVGDLSEKGELGDVQITSGFTNGAGTATIGTAVGTPLLLNMQTLATLTIYATACGNVWLKGGGANGLGAVTVIGTKVAGTQNTVYLDGTIQSFTALKGLVVFAATADMIGNFRTGYITNVLNDVNVTIPFGMTVGGVLECDGGQIASASEFGTLTMTGGQWTQTVSLLNTVNLYGGTLVWNGGNITLANVANGGVLDGSQSNASRSLGTAYVNFGGYVNLNNGSRSISVSVGIFLNGGEFDVTPGTEIGMLN